MLVLEGESKAVDDRPKNLEQLRDAVVPLCFIDKPVEYVGDRLADVGAVRHKLAVDAVENRLEVVPLPRVLLRVFGV